MYSFLFYFYYHFFRKHGIDNKSYNGAIIAWSQFSTFYLFWEILHINGIVENTIWDSLGGHASAKWGIYGILFVWATIVTFYYLYPIPKDRLKETLLKYDERIGEDNILRLKYKVLAFVISFGPYIIGFILHRCYFPESWD